MFAFAGIVAFHRGADWRAQRFDALRAKAEERRAKAGWKPSDKNHLPIDTNDMPDEGLVGF
jgi:hypothetical protein